MKQGILQWSPSSPNPITSLSLFSSFSQSIKFTPKSFKPFTLISSTLNSLEKNPEQEQIELEKLPARERRKLKNERRQSKAVNWKDEVEMILIKKPKKRFASWTEELNLDYLAQLGPQWWVVRVSRVTGQFTVERLALSLSNNYPHMEFKMYYPAVQEKRKLKNGSISVKSKPIFPGCVFLRCVMNKEIHDFVRDSDGIGGFIGSKVGNTKRQINKPRPVDEEDMEKIFRQAKEEQERADLAFQEKHKPVLQSLMPDLDTLTGAAGTPLDTDPKTQSQKASEPARRGRKSKYPKIGSTVRVVSGSFSEFSGIVKKVDKKNETVTVGFTLFGKETISDLGIHMISSDEV